AHHQGGHTIDRRLANIADQLRDSRVARCFSKEIDNKGGSDSRLVFAAMGGEKNLERLEEAWCLARVLQHFLNLLFMLVRHRGNDGVLVLEIAINQADANASFRTDVVHAGLVKAALGEANQSSVEDLSSSIETGF